MMSSSHPARRFTGWHMTATLVAFFAVVIAVNMLMAMVAVQSFGGTVVDNSYVASQRFNGWLAAARTQDRLRWKEEVTVGRARHVVLRLGDDAGSPVRGGTVKALAQHPLGQAADIALAFHEAAPGRYVSGTVLPPGRWRVRLDIRHAGGEQHLLREID